MFQKKTCVTICAYIYTYYMYVRLYIPFIYLKISHKSPMMSPFRVTQRPAVATAFFVRSSEVLPKLLRLRGFTGPIGWTNGTPRCLRSHGFWQGFLGWKNSTLNMDESYLSLFLEKKNQLKCGWSSEIVKICGVGLKLRKRNEYKTRQNRDIWANVQTPI